MIARRLKVIWDWICITLLVFGVVFALIFVISCVIFKIAVLKLKMWWGKK